MARLPAASDCLSFSEIRTKQKSPNSGRACGRGELARAAFAWRPARGSSRSGGQPPPGRVRSAGRAHGCPRLRRRPQAAARVHGARVLPAPADRRQGRSTAAARADLEVRHRPLSVAAAARSAINSRRSSSTCAAPSRARGSSSSRPRVATAAHPTRPASRRHMPAPCDAAQRAAVARADRARVGRVVARRCDVARRRAWPNDRWTDGQRRSATPPVGRACKAARQAPASQASDLAAPAARCAARAIRGPWRARCSGDVAHRASRSEPTTSRHSRSRQVIAS